MWVSGSVVVVEVWVFYDEVVVVDGIVEVC